MFLDFLFGKKESVRPVRPTPQAATHPPVTKPALASGTIIAHHAELVPYLEADHRKLL